MPVSVNGILLLYNHPLQPNAPTIMDHVEAFARHSRFKVWTVNTGLGFPKRLGELEFDTIVLHYSLFGTDGYVLNEYFLRYLDRTSAYKVAFFQDEHHFGPTRFEFLNRHRVDCVYTLLEPPYWDDVYRRHTDVPKLVYNIPGYVPDSLVALGERLTVPDEERPVDVGYRGRTLAAYMGKGGQEKAEIGRRFLELAGGYDLKLDIAVDEGSRIYGENWFTFLAGCRAVLGVEAGVSIFDTSDTVRREAERLVEAEPGIGLEELSARLLDRWEDNIFYRTISPRHFEAAALRVCQILFEGKYSGVLQPMVHYIPLKKDFSNLDEVIGRFRDHELRRTLTDNAHRDLIASRAYSYERFVQSFDEELLAAGRRPAAEPEHAADVTAALARHHRQRAAAMRLRNATLGRQFPGRPVVRRALKPLLDVPREGVRRWKYRRWEKAIASEADN